jgi:hypothetical protein
MSKSPTNGKPSSLTSIAFNTGELMERERIIKLLESLKVVRSMPPEGEWFKVDQAIALIKGENK